MLFLNYTEEPVVREEKLFPGRDVRYTVFAGGFSEYPTDALPDIASRIPAVQSVPVMCLMIAMYMGFSEIYLLGTDHDQFTWSVGHYEHDAFDVPYITTLFDLQHRLQPFFPEV
ncbi:hypothetical protein HJB51_12430 [Rhizobium lentis]|uniref:Uncharacterized protein n=1 Tax=Rhizobium lentis TaxID=1138194 RepID=A0A9Q3QXR3_9HYPH|nr:hypothetical protein [Rhizobium lentis]MBX4998474.1 hypothetical protein [Rhizobium lentis]MBX5009037.1 hypothetical protein [Rhizobium lentis]MBX5017082.1 hypothetical protein [Rhizobium lentis]MBX5023195.1 hypothetical protein [Rhizobium lentis]MBX5040790.1 hypothetical protein [Rhizobium lentis]